MNYYSEEVKTVLNDLETSETGLTSEQVEKRLETFGENKLKAKKGKSKLRRFLEQMADPMIIILIVAAAISGALATVEGGGYVDVIIILTVVIVNAVLGVLQESKAEAAIEALQEMSGSTSRVLRNNDIAEIASKDLVPGDIILLEAGDAIPADARLIESVSLKVEEAALTGESVPVDKIIGTLELKDELIPLGDRRNMVYMGSSVTYGRAKAVIVSTGMQTEMGKIAGALESARDGKTPLQIKLDQLSKILTKVVLGICAVVFVIQLIQARGLDFETVLDSFMIAVSLAVAAIPEGLVAVVTVVLSIGVTNMSKNRAIVRKLTAVETLGCTQIICSDKTGTLTQNKMTVIDHYGDTENDLALGIALCCDASYNEEGEAIGEPTEVGLIEWAKKLGMPKPQLTNDYPRIGEAPFDSMRKMMSTIHKHNDEIIQFTKGAPDVVIDRCTTYIENGEVKPLTDDVKQAIIKANKEMANQALRVLALATKTYTAMPETDPNVLEHDLCFVGLSGMMDPIRPEVKQAIEECKDAGIRPIMITGDHVDTATAIAKQLGILKDGERAVTGVELSKMSDEEYALIYDQISVYARVQPEHKTRIVNQWENSGHITAMTGDGVNDAPSIKAADIGVGMGITGTDVTKNVADMVLADDNFATIVNAVEEGRRIYDNIRKSIQFLLGSNMSEVISIFVATLMGFVILKPVHLLWINLVTDCFPALALGVEYAEPNIMHRKPRDSKDGLFANGMGVDVIYQGILVSVLVLLSYFIGVYVETGSWAITNSNDGTTMAFLTMSMAEIFHSFNMRSQRGSIFKLGSHNKYLYISAIVSLIMTTVVCEVPSIASAFSFTSVELNEYCIAIGLGFSVIPIVELVKFFQRKHDLKSIQA